MRTLIFALLTLLATPAIALDWGYYANTRFGYSIEIPPDYLGQGESANGDGQEFQHRRGAQRLLVWGGLLGTAHESFDAEVKARIGYAIGGTWSVTYQAITPDWASFSGVKGSRILYQRMILLCDRQSYAAFSLEYSARNSVAMDTIIHHLVASLRREGC